jgi:hypothetical protein
MSTQPEEIESEIEEGEIVSDEEIEETEDDMPEEDDEDLMFEDEGIDLPSLMTSLLATEDGDTVCSALVGISQQLQMQNKILIKILSELKN